QPRRGAIGLEIANAVAERIRSGEKAEDAWTKVGKEVHLGESAVQGHWTRWKPEIIAITRERARTLLPPDTTDAELDAYARFVALRSGAKPGDERIFQMVNRRMDSGHQTSRDDD